jgi:hypothetical protein
MGGARIPSYYITIYYYIIKKVTKVTKFREKNKVL